VLTAVCSLPSSLRIPAQKFVSVSGELNHNSSPVVLIPTRVCTVTTPLHSSGAVGAKFYGAKMFDLGEQQHFCLGRLFSKHKMTRHAKNFGGRRPLGPPGYAYAS